MTKAKIPCEVIQTQNRAFSTELRKYLTGLRQAGQISQNMKTRYETVKAQHEKSDGICIEQMPGLKGTGEARVIGSIGCP